MPYITKQARLEIADGRAPKDVGELTYLIFEVPRVIEDIEDYKQAMWQAIWHYLHGQTTQTFSTYAQVIAALNCARMEWRRRRPDEWKYRVAGAQSTLVEYDFYAEWIAPYEDQKIKVNGDVFPEEVQG